MRSYHVALGYASALPRKTKSMECELKKNSLADLENLSYPKLPTPPDILRNNPGSQPPRDKISWRARHRIYRKTLISFSKQPLFSRVSQPG